MWLKKNRKIIIVILIIFVSIFLFYLNHKKNSEVFLSNNNLDIESSGLLNEIEEVSLDNFIEFKDNTYNFSLFYPKNLSINEYDEGSGAKTITFQDIETATGFQIFIVPYNEKQVSDEQFHKDIPSGVRENIINVKIDGINAAIFDSYDDFLGETKEIWFINNGYLYEITTLKEYESSINDIIGTLKFI